MMITMIMLNKQVDSAGCCLIGIVFGVTTTKYPPITILSKICEYLPVPNNPIPVSFLSLTVDGCCNNTHNCHLEALCKLIEFLCCKMMTHNFSRHYASINKQFSSYNPVNVQFNE